MMQIKAALDPLQMIHDLYSTRKRAILRVQTKALSRMTRKLVSKGFEWILPAALELSF